MEKLSLALDELVVESFTPADHPPRRGTVHAHNSGPYTDECQSCGVETGCGWPGGCSADVSCQGSCGCATANTCYGYWSCTPMATCGCQDTQAWCDTNNCTGPGAAC